MGNMSYCRFNNTSLDLQECAEVLGEMIEGTGEPLSQEELGRAKNLAATCFDIVQMLTEYAGIAIEEARQEDMWAAVESLNNERSGKSDEDEEEDQEA